MTLGRQYLQIPGPTNVPYRVTLKMTQPLINHRSQEFIELFADCTAGMKRIFQTKNDIIFFPSSGSGGLEAALVNTLSPGDRILAAINGVFSERWTEQATRQGIEVKKIEVPWGESPDPQAVLDELKKDDSIKAVLYMHNETSTGVVNDIGPLGKAMHEMGHQALLMVDTISGLALADLQVDNWHIDVAVAGSQKGMMLPPGMSMLSVSERAWQAYEKSTMPKWYWDWKQIKTQAENGRTPYTPPTTLLIGLREVLAMFEEEGLQNMFARHKKLGYAVRQAVRALGLGVLPKEEVASPSVSAVNQPQDIDQEEMLRILREDYNTVVGTGLQRLDGKIFRLGHMGHIHEPEILSMIGVLELTLARLGRPELLGVGLKAAQEVLADV